MSASTSSKKKKSPEGLIITGGNESNRKAQWKIGKRVGEGACASVHLLDNMDGSSTGFVVKVVPVPTKTTKQGKGPEETNARLLNHEALMYQNQLPEYQGYIIPKMPPYIGPPSRAIVDGFEFITIERMKGSLWDAIPLLLDKASDEIAVGPILNQILLMVQHFHNMNHILVDVKADNIMMAFSDHDRRNADAALAKILPSRAKKAAPKSKGASLERAQDVARKLRILDFGLVTTWSGPDGIRPDAGISGVVGTPLYASLNVHAGHTPSRRDDIEAMIYVCAELIIRLVAASNGTYKELEGKGKQIPGFLPWSREKSDEAIGKMKENQVTNIKSEFYERMGSKATAKAVKDMLELVQELGFKKSPDYDAICDIMSQVKVCAHVPKKKAATKTPTKKATGRSSASATTTTTTANSLTNTARVTRSTRSKRTAEEQEEEEDGSPPKQQKKAARAKKDADQFVDAMDIDSDEDKDEGTHYEDAEESMDWEPDTNTKENQGSSGSDLGITILVQKGPHAKEKFDLLQSGVDAVVIGKKPTHSKITPKLALWPFPRETSISDSQVRLELKASKQLCSVKVCQLKKSGFETKINGKPLKVSNIQAFINDTIQIGDTTLIVQGLKAASKSKGVSVPVSKVAKAPKAKPSKAKPAATQQAEGKPAPATKQGPTVRIAVIRGPHEGKELSMASDDVVHLGSVASGAKKGESFVLALDSAVENQHARFEFKPTKKLFKVKVANLSLSGTFINGKQIPQGKESYAFLNDRVELGDTTIEIRG